jgi:hypothetical protein
MAPMITGMYEASFAQLAKLVEADGADDAAGRVESGRSIPA